MKCFHSKTLCLKLMVANWTYNHSCYTMLEFSGEISRVLCLYGLFFRQKVTSLANFLCNFRFLNDIFIARLKSSKESDYNLLAIAYVTAITMLSCSLFSVLPFCELYLIIMAQVILSSIITPRNRASVTWAISTPAILKSILLNSRRRFVNTRK
jgi:hypothetical protein